VLRDVLGFPAAEAAGILGLTPAAVNSALIRARAGLRSGRDPHDVPLPKSPAEAAVVGRFVDALEHGDLGGLVDLLTRDARLTMPPEAAEFHGPAAITGFFAQLPFWGQELKVAPARANRQPALVYYLPDPWAPVWRAGSMLVLSVRGEQVSGVTRFGNPALLAPFGLPRTLPRG
jgi:RNA polymerase sigma-70 factor (ECF subfamily)